MKMNRTRKILALVGALAVLATIIIFSIKAHRKDLISVETKEVEEKKLLISKVSAFGEIKPKEFVELQAEITGVVIEIYVKEGDTVQNGDLLLRIDPTQTEAETRAQQALLEVALAQAINEKAQISMQETNLQRDRANVRLSEAELLRAEKNLELAQRSFKRKQQLYEDNLISRDMYEETRNELVGAETSLTSSQARLEQARAQVAVARVVLEQAKTSYKVAMSRVEQNRAILTRNKDRLSKTLVRSPLTGVITKMNVEVGERAVPGNLNSPQATLMEIADLSIIEAEIEVDETDIVDIELGQKAEVKVDALPDNPLQGIVTEIGNSAIEIPNQQREAKDFKVVIQLDEPVDTLRPGLSCMSEITTARRQQVLAIPIQALVIREYATDKQGGIIRENPGDKEGKGNKKKSNPGHEKARQGEKKEFQGVFVVSEGKVEFVTVQIGIMGDTEVEITEGLKEGTVIVTGTYQILRKLKDGELVEIDTDGKES